MPGPVLSPPRLCFYFKLSQNPGKVGTFVVFIQNEGVEI